MGIKIWSEAGNVNRIRKILGCLTGLRLKSMCFACFVIMALLLPAFICPALAATITREPIFAHIASPEGLSHDTVYSIVQDKTGYLWFGTEDGLNRYDGLEIEVYSRDYGNNAIGNANCAYLYVDDENDIWIASWGGGIEVLDQDTGNVTTYMNDPNDPSSISDNSIHHIFQDSRGDFWFGSYTKGLNSLNKKTGKFKSYVHSDEEATSISANRVWWVSENPDGTLLVGTNKGLDMFDPKSETFTHFAQIKQRVRTIYWDRAGDLWLGTQGGLCKFNTKTGKGEYYLHGSQNPLDEVITSIYEDSKGNFWVGTSNGIDLFDKTEGTFRKFVHDSDKDTSISNNDIRAIFEDGSANLWIGTRGGGINKLDIKPQKFTHISNEKDATIALSDINVLSVFQSTDGTVYVGTNNGGLNRINFDTFTQEHLMTDVALEENRNLCAISEDADSIWVGGLGGLSRIDKLTGGITTYKSDGDIDGSLSSSTVLSIIKDSKGVLWVGTLAGLNKFDEANDSFIAYRFEADDDTSISSDTINCLYEDAIGSLWVGTQMGLNVYDASTGKFKRFLYNKQTLEGISDNIIHCIFGDSKGNLWIGTQYGLNLYNRDTGSFKSYTTIDGLPNNCIRAIQEDAEGRLWISTNKGVSCFYKDSATFVNYDVIDGLQGNSFNNNACETLKNGTLLFGGTRGLDIIDSKNVYKSGYMPPLAVTEFLIMDKQFDYKNALKEAGKIDLSHSVTRFSVKVASLDFTLPLRNQYAYMLEGLDRDWVYSGTMNTISFTKIPRGNYTLRIKGTNSDGVWNEEGIAYKIRVAPPWWASNYAYAAYICISVLGVIILIQYMTTKQKRRSELLKSRLEKTIAVMSRIGEMRDMYTAGHQKRVQQLSCAIASELGLSKEIVDNIYLGSMIHDIGKVNIAPEFLTKPGKLTELEYKILQTHVLNGYEIIKEIDFPPQVTAIVCQHHERLDGKGYPNGLSGDQILIESRIVAVADVVEAISTDRPYRPALGVDVAIEEITKFRGEKFDEKAVDACIRLFREGKFSFAK